MERRGSEGPDDEDVEAKGGEEETYPRETPEVQSEEFVAESDAATAMASGARGGAGQEGKHTLDSHAEASCDHAVGAERDQELCMNFCICLIIMKVYLASIHPPNVFSLSI